MVKKRPPKPAQAWGGAPRPRTSEWSEEVFLPLLNGFTLGFLGGGEDVEKGQLPLQEEYKWSKLYSICQYFFFWKIQTHQEKNLFK